MTRDDAETERCSRECSSKINSSLRGSVSFCSVKCVVALKFYGDTIIHEISKTHKSFLEIPLINDLIILLISFKIFSESKLREYG